MNRASLLTWRARTFSTRPVLGSLVGELSGERLLELADAGVGR